MAKKLNDQEKNEICRSSIGDVYYKIYECKGILDENYQLPTLNEIFQEVLIILAELGYSHIKIVQDIKDCNCIAQVIIKEDLMGAFSLTDVWAIKFGANFNGKWMSIAGDGSFTDVSLEKAAFTLIIRGNMYPREEITFFEKPTNYFLSIEK